MPSSPHADPASALEVALVQPDALGSLRPDWTALWRRCPRATPFQAPEWLLPWSRHFAPGRTGAVTLRAADGRLAGLLPVFCWHESMLLAGTGPSDRGDLLLDPAHERQAPALLALLLAALPGLRCGAWTRLDLQQLPPASPLRHAPAPTGWSERSLPGEPCHVAPLHGPDGLGAASKRRRANWRYAVRRLEREGATMGLVPGAEAPDAIDDLIRLHRLRWQARGENGVLADPLLRRFLREAGPALADAGCLRLHQLRLGAERVALLMVLASPATHFYYIGGFDPACGTLSPSAALVGAAMAQARTEGATAFDFLRGAEPYKRSWGAESNETHRRILLPPSHQGRTQSD